MVDFKRTKCINTLQQIKDEYAYEAGFADWHVLECYGEDMDKHVDQIAIRYAQEQNKELVEMLKECMRVLSSVQSPATPSILLYREIEKLIKEATEL